MIFQAKKCFFEIVEMQFDSKCHMAKFPLRYWNCLRIKDTFGGQQDDVCLQKLFLQKNKDYYKEYKSYSKNSQQIGQYPKILKDLTFVEK